MRNGIAISAVQPMSVTLVATCHAPSQFTFRPPPDPRCCRLLLGRPLPPPPKRPLPCPSFVTCPSYSTPAGLVPKTKPFRPSWYVSRMMRKLSVSVRSESRRLSAAMMVDGSSV